MSQLPMLSEANLESEEISQGGSMAFVLKANSPKYNPNTAASQALLDTVHMGAQHRVVQTPPRQAGTQCSPT